MQGGKERRRKDESRRNVGNRRVDGEEKIRTEKAKKGIENENK